MTKYTSPAWRLTWMPGGRRLVRSVRDPDREKWHDEIMGGIRQCKAFLLVLSPDAMDSRYVCEELNNPLGLGKPIFPILYRRTRWKDEFASLVQEVQTLDLHSESYTDNFFKLLDGLIAAGSVRPKSYGRPFLRHHAKPGMNVVSRKA